MTHAADGDPAASTEQEATMASIVGSDASETIDAVDGVTNGNDTIFGKGGADKIYGLGGADIIKGGGGADTIYGGTGNDTADYSDSTEAVFVMINSGGGYGEGFGGTAEGDTLWSIENVTGSNYDDWLIGDGGNNTLKGREGNDTLEGGYGTDKLYGGDDDDILKGGAGADVLDGGEGIDTADYSEATSAVQISLYAHIGNWGEAAGDTFTSIENVNGSDYDDQIRGDGGANVLRGYDGADLLVGDGGGDILWGGDGIDTLHGMTGDDTLYGEAGNDFLYGLFENDTLYGGADLDWLEGGDGIDTLDGGTGNDTMIGGADDDTYFVDSAGDVVTEAAGQGSDVVYALIDYTLTAANIETLSLSAGTAISANGNSENNTIYGNAGDNWLDGGGGADNLSGLGGNDTFVFYAGQAHGDVVFEFQGNGAGVGDQLFFGGYGTAADGASFVQLDATHWQINSYDGVYHENITIAAGSTFDPSFDIVLAW
jgi:Ca2+-binding RTX toxin-like protein